MNDFEIVLNKVKTNLIEQGLHGSWIVTGCVIYSDGSGIFTIKSTPFYEKYTVPLSCQDIEIWKKYSKISGYEGDTVNIGEVNNEAAENDYGKPGYQDVSRYQKHIKDSDIRLTSDGATVKKHLDICSELNALYERKNHDYGDSFHKSFEEYGLIMSCIRLEDKLNRLKQLSNGDDQKVLDESICDTLMDLANYAIMTILELKGNEEGN